MRKHFLITLDWRILYLGSYDLGALSWILLVPYKDPELRRNPTSWMGDLSQEQAEKKRN